jgi:hypothetical protein
MIEILYIDDCPNHHGLKQHVENAAQPARRGPADRESPNQQ